MMKLPKAMADKVRALSAAIPDELIHDDADGELGREDDPHVTVKYGLHTGDTDEVPRAIGVDYEDVRLIQAVRHEVAVTGDPEVVVQVAFHRAANSVKVHPNERREGEDKEDGFREGSRVLGT